MPCLLPGLPRPSVHLANLCSVFKPLLSTSVFCRQVPGSACCALLCRSADCLFCATSISYVCLLWHVFYSTEIAFLPAFPQLRLLEGNISWYPQDHTQRLALGCCFTDTGQCSKLGLTQLPHGAIQVRWFLQDPRLAIIIPLIQNLTAFPEKMVLLRPFCQGRPVFREAQPTKASSHAWLHSSSGIMHHPRQVKPNALCHLAPMTCCVLSKPPLQYHFTYGSQTSCPSRNTGAPCHRPSS